LHHHCIIIITPVYTRTGCFFLSVLLLIFIRIPELHASWFHTQNTHTYTNTSARTIPPFHVGRRPPSTKPSKYVTCNCGKRRIYRHCSARFLVNRDQYFFYSGRSSSPDSKKVFHFASSIHALEDSSYCEPDNRSKRRIGTVSSAEHHWYHAVCVSDTSRISNHCTKMESE